MVMKDVTSGKAAEGLMSPHVLIFKIVVNLKSFQNKK